LSKKRRRKADAFAEHPPNVSQRHPSENELEEEGALIKLLEAPYQLEPPTNRNKSAEVQDVVSIPNSKKSLVHDLITVNILK
jgi:hypothetical protein